MEIYTLSQVAAAADMSAATLTRRLAAGRGPVTIRAGRHRLVTGQALQAWLTEEQCAA